MKKMQVIYKEGDHQWSVVARDPEKPNYMIDTNEYLIMSGDNSPANGSGRHGNFSCGVCCN